MVVEIVKLSLKACKLLVNAHTSVNKTIDIEQISFHQFYINNVKSLIILIEFLVVVNKEFIQLKTLLCIRSINIVFHYEPVLRRTLFQNHSICVASLKKGAAI